MTLKTTICISDFVPYDHKSFTGGIHEITPEELTVPDTARGALETLKEYGVHLQFDGAMTFGINILSRAGTKLGTVRKWMNDGWLLELLQDLEELANNPTGHGLRA